MKRAAILRIAEQCGLHSVRIFGSASRPEAVHVNDVDFLVTVEPGRTLLDLIAFSQDVEELLGCRVDVVTEGGINPRLADRIRAEAKSL